MKNCLAHAKVYKVVIQYIVDSAPEVKYTRTFHRLSYYNEWLTLKCNENKTVLQMLLRYDYPDFPELCV